jgi:hypothetical protein
VAAGGGAELGAAVGVVPAVIRTTSRHTIPSVRAAGLRRAPRGARLSTLAPRSSRSRTFNACSLGLLPPPSSQLESFRTVSSCVVDGAATEIVSRAADPGSGVRETAELANKRRICKRPPGLLAFALLARGIPHGAHVDVRRFHRASA